MQKKIDANALELMDRLVTVKRVSKTVKGGRTMSFSALVVVGDGNGHVGYGLGKAGETAEAIRKGREDAKKNMIYVDRNENDSIYHRHIGHFGASNVVMKPAPAGTGIIAGGSVRAVLEMAGIKNITTKCIGSRTKHNVVAAVFEGLKGLKTPEQVARLRGKSVEEVTS
ncbi:MAG: 30S ribosomal protein S5 [Defluviitaleaceae bacterium]|nr:30S ribosomal protein S5 [Defluviitaleaceae bacterium]